MGTSRKNPAIYFKSLELENVRCFGEKQTLRLLDGNGDLSQWTLILGDNGVGKTTLLQCLAWMRPVPVWKEPEKGGKPDDIGPAINNEENEVFNSLLRLASEESLKLAVILTIDQDLGGVTKEGKEIKIGLSVVPDEDGKIDKIEPDKSSYSKLKKRWKELTDLEPTDLEPTIFAYNATRYMGSSNREEREFSDPLASLFAGGPTELYDAEEILLDFDYRALMEKSDNAPKKESDPEEEDPSPSHGERLQQVKRLIAKILPDIKSEKDIKILGPKVLGKSNLPSGVEFDTPYGPVPLSGLSLGYKTTLAWVTDMAVRFYEHYDESLNPLEEPAIVLIDEIDLHLHPRWQRKIMDNLTKHFTKTQFIATTHSPSMAQAAANANLVVLRREDDDDHVVIEDSPRFVEAWRVDQILNVLFGVHSRSPRIEEMFKTRNELLDKLDPTPSDEDKLKDIEEELDNLPTAERREDQEAMDLIRQAAALLKERESHQQ